MPCYWFVKYLCNAYECFLKAHCRSPSVSLRCRFAPKKSDNNTDNNTCTDGQNLRS